MPYSAALLEAYFKSASSAADGFSFLPIIYKREGVNTILSEISNADVLGISLYAWNVKLSLAVAKAFKERNQNSFVFAGGPSVPDSAEEFLKTNSFIDIAIHNEGEVAVSKLLEAIQSQQGLDTVPSSSYLVDDEVVKNSNLERISDLSLIASPFLSGVLERTMRYNSTEKWIGLWETNRGCPFTCTYCDWGSATASKKIGMFDYGRLEEEMNWFSSNKIEYIFCCDANFGMFPRDPEIAKMVGEVKKRTGYPHALSVQNTKNSTERSYLTQKILCDYGLNKGVTLSMQTLSNDALKNIKRSNIKLESYFELQKRFIADKVPTYSDLILALPGETRETYIDGLCKLIESGQHSRIQFNNLSILPNAEMASTQYRKRYGLKTVTTKIVNMHGSLNEEESAVQEEQELVIETSSLPANEWCEIRAISWMVGFLYFDKIAQIPIAVVNGGMGLPFKTIISGLEILNLKDYPVLSGVYSRMIEEAKNIQNGSAEYVYSKEWLGIYWPIDELIFIELCEYGGLTELYEEIKTYLACLVKDSIPEIVEFYGAQEVEEIISEAVALNKWMVNDNKKINIEDSEFNYRWNTHEVFTSRIEGKYSDLKRSDGTLVYTKATDKAMRLEEWLQEVVWYGNKRGDYLRIVQEK
ncbi:hypothetical protein KBY65_07875 [Cyanobium sp. Alchichica 3B3-8F6]|nr:hypothetical protein [Cyanobium sp. Alchichica 3B3-8F6]